LRARQTGDDVDPTGGSSPPPAHSQTPPARDTGVSRPSSAPPRRPLQRTASTRRTPQASASACNSSTWSATRPEALGLLEAAALGLTSGKDITLDQSIQTGYVVESIRRARRFIYIENQYFLSRCTSWVECLNPCPSRSRSRSPLRLDTASGSKRTS